MLRAFATRISLGRGRTRNIAAALHVYGLREALHCIAFPFRCGHKKTHSVSLRVCLGQISTLFG
jgi:hypothetical protein